MALLKTHVQTYDLNFNCSRCNAAKVEYINYDADGTHCKDCYNRCSEHEKKNARRILSIERVSHEMFLYIVPEHTPAEKILHKTIMPYIKGDAFNPPSYLAWKCIVQASAATEKELNKPPIASSQKWFVSLNHTVNYESVDEALKHLPAVTADQRKALNEKHVLVTPSFIIGKY